MISKILKKRALVSELVKRDFTQNYKGSVMGLLWVFVNPLLMLGIYSITFGYILNVRSGMPGDDKAYVITLFAGLILFYALAECINKSTRLITSNQNYVKKIVFPLQILPIVVSLSIMADLLISFIIMIVIQSILLGFPDSQAIFSLLILVVFFPVLLGVGWLFSAVGAIFRDIEQVTGVITHALLFMSPIFYKLDQAPAIIKLIVSLNPLSFIVTQLRLVAIDGGTPDFYGLISYFIWASVFAFVSYSIFMVFNKVYADII